MTEKGLCVRHGTQSPNTAERLVYPAAPKPTAKRVNLSMDDLF